MYRVVVNDVVQSVSSEVELFQKLLEVLKSGENVEVKVVDERGNECVIQKVIDEDVEEVYTDGCEFIQKVVDDVLKTLELSEDEFEEIKKLIHEGSVTEESLRRLLKLHMIKCGVDELELVYIHPWIDYFRFDEVEYSDDSTPTPSLTEYDFIVCPKCRRVLYVRSSNFVDYVGRKVDEVVIPLTYIY